MSLLSSLRSLVTALVNRGRIENDTDEELRAHVQNRADDLEHSGLTRAEAERRARIEFGGHEKFREECRETGGGNLVQVLIQDSRYALRILRRTPLVTAVAVLSLAQRRTPENTQRVAAVLYKDLHQVSAVTR